jgi:hypothetical protein
VPLSEDQEKSLLLLELGKRDDDTAIELTDLLWEQYAGQAVTDPRLRVLLVKRDLLLAFLGLNAELGLRWEEAGVVEDDSKLLANYSALLELVNARIASVSASRGARIGQIARTAPIVIADTTPYPIEPDDRIYRGDPLRASGPR